MAFSSNIQRYIIKVGGGGEAKKILYFKSLLDGEYNRQ